MKINSYIFLLTSFLVLSVSSNLLAQPWIGDTWSYRRLITIDNPGANVLTDYQVKINLNSSNFDFLNANTDGSDIRITANDGVTFIPFWIENWNQAANQATIWIKVPTLPISGSTVFIYYGNASPSIPPLDPVETPPIGPFTKYPGNPILISGQCQNNMLPENLVVDGGKYWVLVTDRCIDGGVLSLVSSTDLINWAYEGVILNSAIVNDPGRTFDSPCIVRANNTWYVFYSNFYGTWNFTSPAPIGIAYSTTGNIMGPYAEIQRDVLLTGPQGSWDGARVSEPYVIQRDNGDWVMVYMGDADPAGGFTEQNGIAISTNGIEGPYVKSSGNPVIPFGPSGSIDAGTIADPWVVKFGNTYYIGYTASPTKVNWNTTYATTTDWVTFTKSNKIILNQGPASWDQNSAFRGAVTRVGDSYLFPYTGQGAAGFQFGFATQPVYMAPPDIINNEEAVFEFYDGFKGTQLDVTKWSISREFAQTGTAIVNNDILTLRAYVSGSLDIITLTGNNSFGPGMLLESFARHPDANGSSLTAAELGFGNASRSNVLRIFDYSSTTNFIKNTTSGGAGGQDFGNLMAQNLTSTDYLLHSIFWRSNTQVDFALGNNTFESITTNIPTVALPPWLMCVALPNQATLLVDWIRVRKWTGVDPGSIIGQEQTNPMPVELSSFSAIIIGSSVKLNWRTETEINNYGFEIERSETQNARSETWFKIGFVNGNGNSNSPKFYAFEDNALTPGKYSYRLKQIDNDGQFEYSKSIQVDFNSPKKFELSQNFPNPFNPITTISWEIPSDDFVTLKIYDVLGNEVHTVVNEYQQAGFYQRNFDASALSSGMYFYTLKTGNLIQTKKMILLK